MNVPIISYFVHAALVTISFLPKVLENLLKSLWISNLGNSDRKTKTVLIYLPFNRDKKSQKD